MNVIIIGVGLIGTSLALALKRAEAGVVITGVDSHALSLSQATGRGAIDAVASLEALPPADVVVLAVPVRQIPVVFAAIAPQLSPTTIVIDVGSTKRDVIEAARALAGHASRFVACHPIAGRERHGPLAADADLFTGKNVIITPQPSNAPADIAAVGALWRGVGASVIEMSPDAHDAVFAAVSHLPHMLAFALVDELARRPNARTLFQHAASGFRDFTRIASSSPDMWRDVALNNRDAIVVEMDAYLSHVQRLRDAIAAADERAIVDLMQRAQDAREQWLSGQLDRFNDNTAG
jgi:prephenate dehydrogenase